MGASVSICNLTNLLINVSIGHVTPLYFENQMPTNSCIQRNVGKVWFTVTAVQWTDGNNEFQSAHSIGPILSFGIDAIVGSTKLDPKPGQSSQEVAKVSKALVEAITTITGIKPNEASNIPSGSKNVLSVSKSNIFAQAGMAICIKGGPSRDMVKLPGESSLYPDRQIISNPNKKPIPPLRIEIVKQGDCS